MIPPERLDRRFRRWVILAAAAVIGIPTVVCLVAATRALGVLPETAGGAQWGGLIGRALLLVLLATPVYLLFAWSAAAGVRVGSVERWVIWVHWLIGAAVFQSEGWRLMAWTFAREAAGAFGRTGASTLAAFLAQAAPYLVFWGAVLHMLIPECEAGAKESVATLSDLSSAARRRFLDLAWGLWPLAMTGLVALDVAPGFWRHTGTAGDIGPLGLWLLGFHPSPSGAGPGAPLARAAVDTAGLVWVVAGVASLTTAIFLAVRRVRMPDAPLSSAAEPPGSSDATPVTDTRAETVTSAAAEIFPAAPASRRPRRKKGDTKAFALQYIVLNLGLLLVIIPLVYSIIASLFTLDTESPSGGMGRAIAAATGALGGSTLPVGVGLPAVVALAIGLIGWALARTGREDADSARAPQASDLSGTTSLLLIALAFWPLGLRWSAELASNSSAPRLLSGGAAWLPNGLILVPLALLSLGPRRRGWLLPMAAAALTVAWVPLNFPVLHALAGPDYASRLLTPSQRAIDSSPGWYGTGPAATTVLFSSLLLIGVAWLAALVLWPRGKE